MSIDNDGHRLIPRDRTILRNPEALYAQQLKKYIENDLHIVVSELGRNSPSSSAPPSTSTRSVSPTTLRDASTFITSQLRLRPKLAALHCHTSSNPPSALPQSQTPDGPSPSTWQAPWADPPPSAITIAEGRGSTSSSSDGDSKRSGPRMPGLRSLLRSSTRTKGRQRSSSAGALHRKPKPTDLGSLPPLEGVFAPDSSTRLTPRSPHSRGWGQPAQEQRKDEIAGGRMSPDSRNRVETSSAPLAAVVTETVATSDDPQRMLVEPSMRMPRPLLADHGRSGASAIRDPSKSADARATHIRSDSASRSNSDHAPAVPANDRRQDDEYPSGRPNMLSSSNSEAAPKDNPAPISVSSPISSKRAVINRGRSKSRDAASSRRLSTFEEQDSSTPPPPSLLSEPHLRIATAIVDRGRQPGQNRRSPSSTDAQSVTEDFDAALGEVKARTTTISLPTEGAQHALSPGPVKRVNGVSSTQLPAASTRRRIVSEKIRPRTVAVIPEHGHLSDADITAISNSVPDASGMPLDPGLEGCGRLVAITSSTQPVGRSSSDIQRIEPRKGRSRSPSTLSTPGPELQLLAGASSGSITSADVSNCVQDGRMANSDSDKASSSGATFTTPSSTTSSLHISYDPSVSPLTPSNVSPSTPTSTSSSTHALKRSDLRPRIELPPTLDARLLATLLQDLPRRERKLDKRAMRMQRTEQELVRREADCAQKADVLAAREAALEKREAVLAAQERALAQDAEKRKQDDCERDEPRKQVGRVQEKERALEVEAEKLHAREDALWGREKELRARIKVLAREDTSWPTVCLSAK